MGDPKYAEHIGTKESLYFFRRRFFDSPEQSKSGIVQQYIYAAESLNSAFRCLASLILVSDIK